jgi:GT2 family glycosyltransferase
MAAGTSPESDRGTSLRDRIAVIIVDYNSESWTRRCLESLVALGRGDLAFVVVDNGQSIDAPALEADFVPTTVLRTTDNLGFAGGVNVGLRFALAEQAAWMLLLNPDTRAEHDFIEPLRRVLEGNPGLAMVGPTLRRDDEGRELLTAGGHLNLWLARPSNRLDDGLLHHTPYAVVPFLTGCAMLIRPEAIRQVGEMEEGYFLYFEDADYAQAMRQGGWQLGYVPDSVLLHQPSSVVGYRSGQYVYYYARNRVWFIRRWGRWYHFASLLTFTLLVKLPGSVVVFGLMERRPSLIREFVRGVWAGISSPPPASGPPG